VKGPPPGEVYHAIESAKKAKSAITFVKRTATSFWPIACNIRQPSFINWAGVRTAWVGWASGGADVVAIIGETIDSRAWEKR